MAPSCLYTDGLATFKADAAKRTRDSKEQKLLEIFLSKNSEAKAAKQCAFALQQDAGKKYGDRDVGGKVKIEKQWISNILGNIQNFVEVSDFVMKKAPESVGMAWFAVSLALTAIQNNFALYALFGAGLTDMTEMMITITHYDRIYDERQQSNFKDSEMLRKLFKDITETYSAMLDFAFSIQRHLSGSGWAKIRHGVKDFFNAEAPKFKAKVDRIAALKKKVLEDSEAAFQEKAFQQFGDVKDAVKENLKDIKNFQTTSEEFYHYQITMSEEIRKTLEDVKTATKPRTRWDWALQEFEKNKTKLKRLENTADPMFEALDEKLEGTCTWFTEHPYYQAWLQAASNDLLCITGREGTGKSTLLASAVVAIDQAVGDSACAVQYLSCGMTSNGEIGDNSPNSLNRISNTLIYQLYELASLDETKPALLETCNKLFNNPKEKKAGRMSKQARRDESIPDLAEALTQLSTILARRVIFVLDAIDCMNNDDQDEFFSICQELLNRTQDGSGKGHVQILVACCSDSNSAFYKQVKAGGNFINIEEYNSADIDTIIANQLAPLVWSASQKDEAKEAIKQRAGAFIKYVVTIAMPFIREPFQGGLTERLQDLPKSMDESYSHALHAMPPNYLDLLHTALSWTLFSSRPMKVIEIMEAFSKTYANPPTDEELKAFDGKEPTWTRPASELEVQQLEKCADPFLDVWKNDAYDEYVVDLKDYSQVQQFCLRTGPESSPDRADDEVLCSRCRRIESHAPDRFSFTEKEAHLNLAIACVSALCNPLFWKRYYGWPSGESNGGQSDNTNGKANEESGGQEDDHENEAVNGTVKSTENPEAPETSANEAAANEDGYDSDDSMDNEDRGLSVFKRDTPTTFEDQSADPTNWGYEHYVRYEMVFWYYHIRKAEELWRGQDKANHPGWGKLIAQLDRLAFQCPVEFARCQWMIFFREGLGENSGPVYMQKPWSPLHIGALLGLTTWVEHLIDLGESLTEICQSRTPLQAAIRGKATDEMLRLLLAKGADPNNENENRMPACFSILIDDPTPETMQLFIDHGAKLNIQDMLFQWGALHYFAWHCDNLQVLELLLAQPRENRPNINARDRVGESPLHLLLRRRDVPINVLEAFIKHEADVDAEDHDSERPLQEASLWGDIEIMKMILPRVKEINDPDKYGRTAIHQASWEGYVECVRLLLEHGADANVQDKHDRTPLFFACLGDNNGSAETAMLLLDTLRKQDGLSPMEINKATKRGRSPLRQAAANGFSGVVSTILDVIASAESSDSTALINKADTRKKRTALHCASFWGRPECVRLLLSHGASVAPVDEDEKTALELAYGQWILSAQKEFEEIIFMLIDADPAAAVKDPELISAAATNGSKAILEKLHGLQASLNKADRWGWTPLMVAQRFGHTSAEEFLARVDVMPLKWKTNVPEIHVSDDGLSISCSASDVYSISTNLPLPAGHQKFYFEMTLKPQERADDEDEIFPSVAIGLCTHGATAIDFPGWEPRDKAPHARSWGYHGDDGAFAISNGSFETSMDRRYGYGDTVGCGIDYNTHMMWFTKNGQKLESTQFKDVRGRLFPVIGLDDENPVEMETNFGSKDFAWKGVDTPAEANEVNGSGNENGIEEVTNGIQEIKIE